MRTALLLLAMIATPVVASQTVWKWVDEQGVTHFSDRPVPGATKVEISSSNRAEASAAPSVSTNTPPPSPSNVQYRTFEISQPSEGESFINTGGQVAVGVRLEPRLQPGHTLALYLDGRVVEGFPDNATEYALNEVSRGQHTVLARISDERGQAVRQTDAVHFTVRQESVAQPPVGPALKPPPKPRPGPVTKLRSTQPSYGDLNGQPPRIDPRTNAPKRS